MSLYISHHLCANIVPVLFRTFVRAYVRPHVTGTDNLPKEGAFILAANHNSHADTAVLFTALPRDIRQRSLAAAAQDYFFDKGLRQMVSRILFNVIPVARESGGGQNPLRHVIRALREGYGVLLYPEGTRSLQGTVGPFRKGIGRLIAEFPDVPVIPVWIEGTNRVMPKGQNIPQPLKVEVHFGEPLYPGADLRDKTSWQVAADKVRDAVILTGEQAMQEQDDEAATEDDAEVPDELVASDEVVESPELDSPVEPAHPPEPKKTK
ncbi:MAG: lysophospholipid acyltransferase family protein [Chloroflexota bacterium]